MKHKRINTEKLDQDISGVFDKYNAFYAFSKEQVKENLKENIYYVQRHSLFIEAGKEDDFDLELEKAYKNYRAEVVKNYTKEEIIMDSLLNHACFYDRSDLDRAIDYVKQFNITEEEVLKFFETQLKIYKETDEDVFFGNADEDVFFNNN